MFIAKQMSQKLISFSVISINFQLNVIYPWSTITGMNRDESSKESGLLYELMGNWLCLCSTICIGWPAATLSTARSPCVSFWQNLTICKIRHKHPDTSAQRSKSSRNHRTRIRTYPQVSSNITDPHNCYNLLQNSFFFSKWTSCHQKVKYTWENNNNE